MSEIFKNNNENIKDKNDSATELKNITELGDKFKELSPENTEDCCKILNESFFKLLEEGNTKDGNRYDFYAALNSKVENPLGFNS